MKLRAKRVSGSQRYIPAVAGNRDQPEGERIEVELMPLKQRFINSIHVDLALESAKQRKGNKGDIQKPIMDAVCENVIKIINCQLDDGSPISNGTQLVEAYDESYGDSPNPLDELIDELWSALTNMSKLDEGLVKNSASSQPSLATDAPPNTTASGATKG